MSGYSFWLFTSHKLSSHRFLISCLLWRGPPFKGHVWELWNLTEEVASDWGAYLLVPRLPQRLRLSVSKCLACFFLDCFSHPLPHRVKNFFFPHAWQFYLNIFFHCFRPLLPVISSSETMNNPFPSITLLLRSSTRDWAHAPCSGSAES